jgi:hypothetical protein
MTMNRSSAAFITILGASWLLFVAAVYLPDIGRGFVKDDFGWVETGRAALHAPADPLVRPRAGFYRPVVDFSFAIDYLAHDIRPRGYGFTNLALYVACVAALWILGRAANLSPPAATLAAIVWAVNPHGINMALVWISGRTSLCLTLFALLSAIALLKQRYVWMAAFLAAALGSKEEAIVLPVILLAWHWLLIDRAGDRWRVAAAVAAPVAFYLALRLHTGAFTPASAPSYYQFSRAPGLLLRNLAEYADRGATVCAIALALTAATYRRAPELDPRHRRLLAACAVWFAGGYVLTVFLPVRSSLYAVFPSIGAAIACGAVMEATMMRAAAQRGSMVRLAAVMAGLLLAFVPTYRARNGRYVEPARFSARALHIIGRDSAALPADGVIVLHDVEDPTSNFVGAFGTFASNAVRLHTRRNVNVWIDPPPGDWQLAGLRAPRPQEVSGAFAVERGRIFNVDFSSRSRLR